jgi:hypothetical protein
MRRSLTLAIVLTALAPGKASLAQGGPPPGEIRCEYSQKIECTSGGCQPGPPGPAHLRLPAASALVAATGRAANAAALPSIQVCDGKACAPIVVRAASSGVFVNIAQDGGAHFVKVAMRDVPPGIRRGDFIEVAARFLTTVTYVGRCEALAR